MIPLGTPLDTTDFDALLALARGRLPALSKQWTDYNYHDPGIMLVELLAWLADSQIYSLARNRSDERLGFLRLMGSRARGATPANGLVYPAAQPDVSRQIARGAVLKPARGGAPRIEADAELTLLPVSITRIVTLGPAGMADVTETNARVRAVFPAFGPAGDGELRIELARQPGPAGAGPVLLSLGFRLENGATGPAVQRFGRVRAYGGNGAPLRRTRDTTLGLQRSGAMIFALDAAQLDQPIILRPESGYSLNPRLLAIAPNALPVEQRARFASDAWRGNSRPGQTIEIEPAALFPADEATDGRIWRLVDGVAALQVSMAAGGDWQQWTRGRLDEAGPADRRYAAEEAADGGRLTLRFGNGINGRRPSLDAPIRIELTLSCGLGGAIVQPTDWTMEPVGIRWRNVDPITGGGNAQSPDEALGALRRRLGERRPLATAQQLEAAALALPQALGIARTHVEAGWERGRRAPATAATRTLIAVSRDPGSEEPAWLEAIRRRLAPRVVAGERLLVAAPIYRRFTLAVEVVAKTGTEPARVAAVVGKALADRFDPSRHWPFGRNVSAAVIAGWARKVEGVAGVVAVRLASAAGGAAVPSIAVGRGELPLLVGDPAVTLERQAQ